MHGFKKELDRIVIWLNLIVEPGGGDSSMPEQLRLRVGRSWPFPKHRGKP
jgi:hypothetical protein